MALNCEVFCYVILYLFQFLLAKDNTHFKEDGMETGNVVRYNLAILVKHFSLSFESFFFWTIIPLIQLNLDKSYFFKLDALAVSPSRL